MSTDPFDIMDKYFSEGDGAKAVSFTERNKVFKGVLMEPPVERQQTAPDGTLKYFDKEEKQPRMQLVFKFQTDERDPLDPQDKGVRSLWTKIEQIRAIREALKSQGLTRMEVGGTLEIKWHDEIPPKTRGHNATKLFVARWTPPPMGFMAEKTAAAFDDSPAPTAQKASSPIDTLRSLQGAAGPQRGDDSSIPF